MLQDLLAKMCQVWLDDQRRPPQQSLHSLNKVLTLAVLATGRTAYTCTKTTLIQNGSKKANKKLRLFMNYDVQSARAQWYYTLGERTNKQNMQSFRDES